jgi:VWFA-related protein
MRRAIRSTLVAAVSAVSLAATLRATPQTPAKADGKDRGSGVTAILVDVVVRDKAGNPVRDLGPQDFKITEDGVEQQIGSVTPIFRSEPASGAPLAASQPAASVAAPAPSVPGAEAVAAAVNAPGEALALVFDRLSPDSRTLAYKAALTYVDQPASRERLMALYGIDLGLVPYQWFTHDVQQIRHAIEAFGNRATSQFGSTTAQRLEAQEQARAAGLAQGAAEQAAAAGGPGGSGGQNIAGAAGDAQFAAMQQQMLQTFDDLERDQQGYSTANALMAVVSSMRNIPGRKAIVFFSEGLSIPPNAQDRFLSVAAAANRANVSIYAVDVAGLRTISTLKEARDEINAASLRRLDQDPTRDQVGEPMTAALERNENYLRMDPHSGLGRLALETGGLLVANTNDFRRGLGRVDSDLQNYYMLSYVPRNEEFDGKYRDIVVKVARSGVTVQHRKGYYAVRAPAGAPVLSNEAPALAALDKTPVPNAFPVRAAALSFPEADHPGLTPVVVELPTSGLLFRPSESDSKKFESDSTVLIRFTDESGTVIEKASQRYQLQGSIDEIDKAKTGRIIFYRQPELPPGLYRMETVVYDVLAKKASVRFATVESRAVDASKLRMSTLMVIERGEKSAPSEGTRSPLYVGDMLLYPNLGTPLKQGVDKELGFYFTAYVPAGQGDATATLELLQSAKPLASVPLTLDAPDAQGRIQQVSRIPIEQLQPGTYELRVIVHQGAASVAQTTPFRVVG